MILDQLDTQTISLREVINALNKGVFSFVLVASMKIGNNDNAVFFHTGAYCPAPVYFSKLENRLIMDWDFMRLARILKPCKINARFYDCDTYDFLSYSRYTVATDIFMLTERASVVAGVRGLQFYNPPNVPLPERRPLKDGFNAGSIITKRIDDFIADRIMGKTKFGVEVSGGIDSTAILAILKHYNSLPLSLCRILTDPGDKSIQLDRIEKKEKTIGARIKTFNAWLFLSQTCTINSSRYPDDAYGEYCYGAFGAMWNYFVKEKCTASIGGYGADELFLMPSASPIIGDENDINSTDSFLEPIVSPSALTACANHAPSLLRRGLWPVRPFCDPWLHRFCHSLLGEVTADKEPIRKAINGTFGTEIFSRGYQKDSFDRIISDAIKDTLGHLSNFNVRNLHPAEIWVSHLSQAIGQRPHHFIFLTAGIEGMETECLYQILANDKRFTDCTINTLLDGYHCVYKIISNFEIYYAKLYSRALPSGCGPAREVEILRALPSNLAVEAIFSTRFSMRNKHAERELIVFSDAGGRIPELTIEDYEKIGIYLAKLHQAGSKFSNSQLNQISVEKIFLSAIEEIGSNDDCDLRRILFICMKISTDVLEGKKLCMSFIHGDARADNARISNDRVKFFDFEHCGYGPSVFDLSTVIWWLIELEHQSKLELIRYFLDSYLNLFPQVKNDLDLMPIFIAANEVRAIPLLWRTTISGSTIRKELSSRLIDLLTSYKFDHWSIIPSTLREVLNARCSQ